LEATYDKRYDSGDKGTDDNAGHQQYTDPKRTSVVHFAGLGHQLAVRVTSSSSSSFIRHETAAAARWALLLIVRTLFNDAITVAVWTGFHMCLPVDTLASLTRQAKEKLQSQFFSHSVRRSVLAPRSSSPKLR
jgi:hypothetical protein